MPIRKYLDFIQFHHTLFALPFGLIGYLVSVRGRVDWKDLLFAVLAMAGARTAAMAFNRIVDRKIDGINPRTRDRHLVTGAISLRSAWLLFLGGVLVFELSALAVGLLAFLLSPVALVILLGYSYTKRFTSCSHFILGLALGVAPVGGWIAGAKAFAVPPIVLGLGVLFWVAGFDIIYACQDERFDREHGLHSLVRDLGIRKALIVSAVSHGLSLIFFLGFGLLAGLGVSYYCALGIAGACIVYQHRIVSPEDLSRLNRAFFTMSGIVSMVMLGGVVVDVFIR